MILAAVFLAAAAPQSCADLKVVTDGASVGEHFSAGSSELAKLDASVRAGFAHACSKGVLKTESMVTLGAKSGLLHLQNAPEGNIAILSADQQRGKDWRLVLEYPFVATDGAARVPTAEEVEEAIYCAAVGATVKEQEESGRCLAD
jgi:hypothetical protein